MLKFADLQGAPERLTLRQIQAVCAAALIALVGRLLAVSASPWDWDEALFSTALRDYDVAAHSPHPPGFPIFIALARVVSLLGASGFRSVQTVTVIGAIALFPVMFFLGRELRLPFRTNLIASLLLVHFPNVWFFGGGAFSDVPSLTLVLLACALLLRGCRDDRAYLAGALVLGIAAGFRTQNLLVGLAPALLASWCRVRSTRSPRLLLIAIAIGGGTLAIAYGGAAIASGGWERYDRAVAGHREYIARVDSFRSPGRPQLSSVFEDFFIRPYRAGVRNVVVALLALAGLVAGVARRRGAVLLALAIFVPFSIVGWLMLDHHSAGRFSVAWAPLIAILAATGLAVLIGFAVRGDRWASMRRWVEGLAAAWLIVELILWTIPALNQVRQTASPPMQALEWIRANVPPDSRINVHGSMAPFARFLRDDYVLTTFDEVPPGVVGSGAWLLDEGVSRDAGARNFAYRRNNLWKIARHRYFEVSVRPHTAAIRFLGGWHAAEGSDTSSWRWMGLRSVTELGAIEGPARLQLRFYAPLDALPQRPTVSVWFNGTLLERFVAEEADVAREYDVVGRPGAPNELILETSHAVNPARQGIDADARDLGLRLDGLTWHARK